MTDSLCPCGSKVNYTHCCLPLHQGAAATTPEALMRSRYCAFELQLINYLLQSWHSSTRPAQLDLRDSPNWKSLHVLSASQQNDNGRVHFRARYQTGKEWGFLEEESDFVYEAGHWFYVAGKTREEQLKPRRNDQCPCGSTKKFKVCCG
jgi:SEC-C motif-containing protein